MPIANAFIHVIDGDAAVRSAHNAQMDILMLKKRESRSKLSRSGV